MPLTSNFMRALQLIRLNVYSIAFPRNDTQRHSTVAITRNTGRCHGNVKKFKRLYHKRLNFQRVKKRYNRLKNGIANKL